MSNQPILQVAAKAAIVDHKGQVLIIREAATGEENTNVTKWGLVGGRLQPGESFLDGLKREVREETGLVVEPVRPLRVGEWHPVIKGVPHQVIAIFMLCRAKDQTVKLSNEHDAYEWIDPTTRQSYKMVEPDCFVVDDLV